MKRSLALTLTPRVCLSRLVCETRLISPKRTAPKSYGRLQVRFFPRGYSTTLSAIVVSGVAAQINTTAQSRVSILRVGGTFDNVALVAVQNVVVDRLHYHSPMASGVQGTVAVFGINMPAVATRVRTLLVEGVEYRGIYFAPGAGGTTERDMFASLLYLGQGLTNDKNDADLSAASAIRVLNSRVTIANAEVISLSAALVVVEQLVQGVGRLEVNSSTLVLNVFRSTSSGNTFLGVVHLRQIAHVSSGIAMDDLRIEHAPPNLGSASSPGNYPGYFVNVTTVTFAHTVDNVSAISLSRLVAIDGEPFINSNTQGDLYASAVRFSANVTGVGRISIASSHARMQGTLYKRFRLWSLAVVRVEGFVVQAAELVVVGCGVQTGMNLRADDAFEAHVVLRRLESDDAAAATVSDGRKHPGALDLLRVIDCAIDVFGGSAGVTFYGDVNLVGVFLQHAPCLVRGSIEIERVRVALLHPTQLDSNPTSAIWIGAFATHALNDGDVEFGPSRLSAPTKPPAAGQHLRVSGCTAQLPHFPVTASREVHVSVLLLIAAHTAHDFILDRARGYSIEATDNEIIGCSKLVAERVLLVIVAIRIVNGGLRASALMNAFLNATSNRISKTRTTFVYAQLSDVRIFYSGGLGLMNVSGVELKLNELYNIVSNSSSSVLGFFGGGGGRMNCSFAPGISAPNEAPEFEVVELRFDSNTIRSSGAARIVAVDLRGLMPTQKAAPPPPPSASSYVETNYSHVSIVMSSNVLLMCFGANQSDSIVRILDVAVDAPLLRVSLLSNRFVNYRRSYDMSPIPISAGMEVPVEFQRRFEFVRFAPSIAVNSVENSPWSRAEAVNAQQQLRNKFALNLSDSVVLVDEGSDMLNTPDRAMLFFLENHSYADARVNFGGWLIENNFLSTSQMSVLQLGGSSALAFAQIDSDGNSAPSRWLVVDNNRVSNAATTAARVISAPSAMSAQKAAGPSVNSWLEHSDVGVQIGCGNTWLRIYSQLALDEFGTTNNSARRLSFPCTTTSTSTTSSTTSSSSTTISATTTTTSDTTVTTATPAPSLASPTPLAFPTAWSWTAATLETSTTSILQKNDPFSSTTTATATSTTTTAPILPPLIATSSSSTSTSTTRAPPTTTNTVAATTTATPTSGPRPPEHTQSFTAPFKIAAEQALVQPVPATMILVGQIASVGGGSVVSAQLGVRQGILVSAKTCGAAPGPLDLGTHPTQMELADPAVPSDPYRFLRGLLVGDSVIMGSAMALAAVAYAVQLLLERRCRTTTMAPVPRSVDLARRFCNKCCIAAGTAVLVLSGPCAMAASAILFHSPPTATNLWIGVGLGIFTSVLPLVALAAICWFAHKNVALKEVSEGDRVDRSGEQGACARRFNAASDWLFGPWVSPCRRRGEEGTPVAWDGHHWFVRRYGFAFERSSSLAFVVVEALSSLSLNLLVGFTQGTATPTYCKVASIVVLLLQVPPAILCFTVILTRIDIVTSIVANGCNIVTSVFVVVILFAESDDAVSAVSSETALTAMTLLQGAVNVLTSVALMSSFLRSNLWSELKQRESGADVASQFLLDHDILAVLESVVERPDNEARLNVFHNDDDDDDFLPPVAARAGAAAASSSATGNAPALDDAAIELDLDLLEGRANGAGYELDNDHIDLGDFLGDDEIELDLLDMELLAGGGLGAATNEEIEKRRAELGALLTEKHSLL